VPIQGSDSKVRMIPMVPLEELHGVHTIWNVKIAQTNVASGRDGMAIYQTKVKRSSHHLAELVEAHQWALLRVDIYLHLHRLEEETKDRCL